MSNTTRIDEIRARQQAATPGHWGTHYDGTGTYYISAGLRPTPTGTVCDAVVAAVRSEHGDEQAYHDARFIADAREDLAFLLDRVDELEAALAAACPQPETAAAPPQPTGWDQATFRCGQCGTVRTADTEADYLRVVGDHHAAHELAARLDPVERRGFTSVLRVILNDAGLGAEFLALVDQQAEQTATRADEPRNPAPTTRTAGRI
ncbi:MULTISPECIES: hypothetical protein [unclassified Streptomyces]|uniref:hypothetical protein n=1 Tax=unclassified Streptomyces TaxID=2593676 RepID=UPI003809E328